MQFPLLRNAVVVLFSVQLAQPLAVIVLRLGDEPGYMLIRPTIDRKFAPGECSTVSDYKDNVHWFQAITEPAFIFNLHVMDVNPQPTQPTGRVYVDPQGEAVAGGLVRARRIGFKEANELYG